MVLNAGSRFSDDIELMIGTRPSCFWMMCWRYGGPIAMMVIFIASLVEFGNVGTMYETWDAKEVRNNSSWDKALIGKKKYFGREKSPKRL